jgi:hypothetical protein
MKPLSPVPFPAGPAFIDLMPKRSSSLVITSNQGLVNIVDTSNPSSVNEFYQVLITSLAAACNLTLQFQLDTPAFISSAAVSPTGAYMAFGDSDGIIHIMTATNEGMPFNGYEGQPVEWADPPEILPEIEWTDST